MTQRWDWTYRYGRRLLVAAVVSVVVLAVALLVVVTIGGRDADCVVGQWRTVEGEQHLSSGLGTVILDGDGPVETYREDGTGTIDHGDGVTYRVVDTPLGLADGAELVISGTASYDYTVENDTLRYHNVSSDLTQSSEYLDEIPTSIEDERYGYRCEGDTLTLHIEDRYEARLVRLD